MKPSLHTWGLQTLLGRYDLHNCNEIIINCFYSELGIVHLRTFLVRKCLQFLGAQGGALFSNFGCATSSMGAALGAEVS